MTEFCMIFARNFFSGFSFGGGGAGGYAPCPPSPTHMLCWGVVGRSYCVLALCGRTGSVWYSMPVIFIVPISLQCESINSPWHFLTFFPSRWEFVVQILCAYYTFLSTLDYKFLFSYLQLCLSYAVLSATTMMLKMSTIGRNARWVVALNMA